MNFNTAGSMKKQKWKHSPLAERGAEQLVKRIESGDMGMEVMPNSFAQFTGELEEKDYISYCKFLNSENGQKVLRMLEESDEGELLELY